MIAENKSSIIFGISIKTVFKYLFIFSCSVFIAHFCLTIFNGGNDWQQGDWLINNHGITIRRGMLGSAIFMLSDLINVNPLNFLYVLQAGILFFLFSNFYKIMELLLKLHDEFILLITSSSFFLIYWASAPLVGLRKEALVFLAVSCLLVWGIRRNDFFLWIGCIICALGILGHEANILFLPAFIYIFFIFIDGKLKASYLWPYTIIIIASFYTAWITVIHTTANPKLVCDELLSRGLSERLCGGAINYLSTSSVDAFNSYKSYIRIQGLIVFPIAYIMGALASFYFIYLSNIRKQLVTLYVLTALPFFPLYIIAVDWGRWASFHLSSFAFIIMALGLKARVSFIKRMSPKALKALIALALLISISSGVNIIEGGLVKSFFKLFMDL